MPSLPTELTVENYRRILGVPFFVGSVRELLDRTMDGGLIVVPSAPVLVDLVRDDAHRRAVEGCDFAVTDSGFMVLLWRYITGERLERISGLRYLKALLADARFRESADVLWIMPTREDGEGNRAWLAEQGIFVAEEECYVAPMYPRQGPIEDPVLVELIHQRQPQFVMVCLGGGVQERLGFFIRESLRRAAPAAVQALASQPRAIGGFESPDSSDVEPPYRPALICTGAAIAFLSNRQVNIPPWADRLFLGWLMRCLSEPAKFIPRYWRSFRLGKLLWKFRHRSVAVGS